MYGCLVLGLAQPVAAQRYAFVTYSVEEGLAQSVVRALFQDSRGYLWLGTAEGGVSRFDGARFVTLGEEDGLPDSKVHAIAEGPDGRVWLATQRGVAWFDGRHVGRLELETVPAGTPVLSTLCDRSGTLWFGTERQGLVAYDGSHSRRVGGVDDPTVLAMLEVPGGDLWLGTTRGVWRLHGGRLEPVAADKELEQAVVLCLFRDRTGRVWISTERSGVWVDSGDGARRLEHGGVLDRVRVNAVAEDRRGRIWFGTDHGACRLDESGLRAVGTREGLPTAFVLSLLRDAEGNLWFGTLGAGAARLASEAFVNFDGSQGLPGDQVLSIAEGPDGAIWIGALDGGVTRYQDGGMVTFTTAQGLPSNAVSCVRTDRAGDLWVATVGGGVARYDGRRFRTMTTRDGLPEDRVFSILEDRAGGIWFSTWGGGAARWDGDRFEVYDHRQLGSDRVFSVYQDAAGAVWFATSGGGVTRLDGESFRHFTEADGLGRDKVYATLEDRWGRHWFATAGGGLSRFDGTSFRSYTRRDGLTSNVIYLMVFDRTGRLWAGSEDGLDCLTFGDDGELLRVRHFGTEEGFMGLETNQNAVLEDSRGRLWFGTRGVTRFDPDEDPGLAKPPTVHLTGVKLFFEEPDWAELGVATEGWFGLPVGPVLSYRANHLEFTCDAILFAAPKSVRFRYQLEGLDRRWSPPTDRHEVAYSSLPPGEYEFKVRAGSLDGAWSPSAVLLRFRVNPPFWRTWWFLTIALTLSAGAIAGLVAVRTASLRRRHDLLERLVDERTQALRESDCRFQALFERSHDAVCVFDAEGRVADANVKAQELLACPLERLRGRRMFEFLGPDSVAKSRRMLREILETGVSDETGELELRREDGDTRWIELAGVRVDETDDLPQVLAIGRDVTERKRTETLMREAQEAAETANQAKSDFLANMSHELRTPLTGVIGMTDLLNLTELTDEQKELVENLRLSGSALLTVVNDILDFSKVEAGRMELERRPFDPRGCLDYALRLVVAQSRAKGLELSSDVADDVPQLVVGDETRVRQVLGNIVSNAMKFTRRGSIALRLRIVQCSDVKCVLEFSVQDTGIGIPQDRMDRLFKAFSQVDSSTTREYGGTGLGLAISARLVRLMGGRIWVESSPGTGSTFAFTIASSPVAGG